MATMPGPPAADAASPAPPRRSLVFGASGFIGSNLVPRLVQAGHAVRATSRNPETLEARDWPGVERIEADALRPETLEAALAGVDVAYYLVHSMAGGRDFGRRDLEAAENFAAAAARAGVRRIVYLGGLVPEDAASEHLLSRRDTGARLRAGPVPVTEIRAGIIVGPGSAAYEVMRDLVNALPVMLAPKWVRSRSSPIALDNLLHYLVEVADIEEAAGAVLDAGGPEYLSYAEMMRQFGEVVGKRPRIIPVPVLTPGLSSYWMALVTAVPTPVAQALIGGLRHDIPAHDAALRRLVPQTLLGYRDAVRAAIEAERRHPHAVRWTEGLLMFRGSRLDHSFYAKRAGASIVTTASPRALWEVVSAVGGENGYYYMDVLWDVRAVMDRAVGGQGLGEGRPHPGALRIGEHFDCWTVLALEPERRLTLRFDMRAPGSGVLEFEIQPQPHGARTKLTVTAYWHPHGVWGLSYWYAMVPAHLFLFKGMVASIAERAAAIDRQAGRAPPRRPAAAAEAPAAAAEVTPPTTVSGIPPGPPPG